MEPCVHDCSSCQVDCSSRKPEDMIAKPHKKSRIKKVIGVVSGKGGVGKSMVTELLAVAFSRQGYHCGILDADATGPSIPKAFGITERAKGNKDGLYPATSPGGIDVMSVNLLLDDDTTPVLWRGPVVAGVITQFWTDVIWEDIDYLFIDMPPGTGDVSLTVFQSIPIDGIVMVTTPQDLVSMIVAKAVNMAETMNVPIYGIIENMSYVTCPDCGRRLHIFGESHSKELSEEYGLLTLAHLPLDPDLAHHVDQGTIEEVDPAGYLADAIQVIQNTDFRKEETSL